MGGGHARKFLSAVAWEESMWRCGGHSALNRNKEWQVFSQISLQCLESSDSFAFPLRSIWNTQVQPKITFFAWEAIWGKTLTLDLIQKKGWVLANRYFMCHKSEETIDHLLIHCAKTRVLWELLFSLVRVSRVLPSSVRETLVSWHGSFVVKKCKKI